MAATLNVGAVSVTTTATLVKTSNTNRVSIIIQNLGPSSDIYVGPTSAVTTATGLRVSANDSLDGIVYTGTLYAITAVGSADVRYFEEVT